MICCFFSSRMNKSNKRILFCHHFTFHSTLDVIVCIHLGGYGEHLSEYSLDVVAMGTGSKCIGKSKMSHQGNTLSSGGTQGNKSDSVNTVSSSPRNILIL